MSDAFRAKWQILDVQIRYQKHRTQKTKQTKTKESATEKHATLVQSSNQSSVKIFVFRVSFEILESAGLIQINPIRPWQGQGIVNCGFAFRFLGFLFQLGLCTCLRVHCKHFLCPSKQKDALFEIQRRVAKLFEETRQFY